MQSLVEEGGKLLLNTFLLNETHTFILTGVRYGHKLFKTPVPKFIPRKENETEIAVNLCYQWTWCVRKMVSNIIVKAFFSLHFFQCLLESLNCFFNQIYLLNC